MIINAHEIESIIPLQMILDMMNGQDSTYGSDTISNAEELRIYSNTDFRRFFDHKNGISLKTAIEYDLNNGEDYWLNFFSHNASMKECYKDKLCHNCNSCPVIKGLGDRLLNSIVLFLQRNNTRKYSTTMEEFILTEWEKIGRELLSWGCTPATRVSRSS